MAKLTVIGSKGLLGSTLCRMAESAGHDVTGFDIEEMDISDHRAMAGWTPDADWVVNCAAITDVDACETGDGAALSLLVNAVAPEVIAAACERAGAGFVHVSTDYVFFGDGMGAGEDGQYDETDDPAPRNRYGSHKLMGEVGARSHGAYVLRTAWLYGPGGKNFVSKSYELACGGKPLTVDNVCSATPTLASNLARYILAVVQADDRKSGETYHCCDAGEATRWEMFARIRRAMLPATEGWKIARGDMYAGGPATRPVRTPLDSSAFFMRFGRTEGQMGAKEAAVEFVSQCRENERHIVSGEVRE